VPHPNTFTPEGLFSEHDLPAPEGHTCQQVLCVIGATAPVELITQPEARTLAQLAFATNIDARTWQRAPVSLIAVVDKSGSMSGAPLETVKASLHTVADLLGPADQLTVVLYGDRVHVQVPTTPAGNKRPLHAAIDGITSEGSTDMESGLRMGFDVARRTSSHFKAAARGSCSSPTSAPTWVPPRRGFMDLAREGSKRRHRPHHRRRRHPLRRRARHRHQQRPGRQSLLTFPMLRP
jgi:Ca-activated chloride channel family protein